MKEPLYWLFQSVCEAETRKVGVLQCRMNVMFSINQCLKGSSTDSLLCSKLFKLAKVPNDGNNFLDGIF